MIPFNRPSTGGLEIEYIRQAVSNGYISGNGPFTKRSESMLSAMHNESAALLTTSCTHSLEMAARLLNLNLDDEVIVPSYTFVSTASAFMWNGAKPVFCDSRRDTLNIDPDIAESLITPRTKAICIVHYAGVGAEPDRFADIAQRHGLALIEDNAHGLSGKYKGQTLGTFGDLSTLSFHETKNITCGEGGAIILNNSSFLERAEILREKGTNRSRFLRGQVDKYTWVDNGSSWVLSDLLAAFLVAQLERFDEIQGHRMRLWQVYQEELAAWASEIGAQLPHIPEEAEHTGHMFYLQLQSEEERTSFIEHMRDRGVMSVFHYQALHESPMGESLGVGISCPVASEASQRLVRLPLFSDMSVSEQSQCIEAVLSFRP